MGPDWADAHQAGAIDCALAGWDIAEATHASGWDDAGGRALAICDSDRTSLAFGGSAGGGAFWYAA